MIYKLFIDCVVNCPSNHKIVVLHTVWIVCGLSSFDKCRDTQPKLCNLCIDSFENCQIMMKTEALFSLYYVNGLYSIFVVLS